jgi:ribose transport system substrate-binding protein
VEEGGTAPAQTERYTIAVIPKGTTHEFWKAVYAGATKAADERDVDVIWKGPLREDDRDAQISVVEDFISRRVSGIVLAPLDDVALRMPVKQAIDTGIPVVIFDSGLQSEDYVSFVATDNRRAGAMAGEYLGTLLNGQGRVAMLRYQEGSESTMNREEGFLEAIGAFQGIEVVTANQFGGATTETAYQASENILTRMDTPLDGIFCPNESTTFGMLRALQDAGLAGTIRFVGFDTSDKMIEAIRAGELDATVVQNPMKMGYLGVTTLVDHLNGKEVEKRIDTGATLVTKENLDTPEVQQLVSPSPGQPLSE